MFFQEDNRPYFDIVNFCLKCFSKESLGVISNPRYLYEFTISMLCLPYCHLSALETIPPFRKIIIFDFFKLMLRFHNSQYFCSLLIMYCSVIGSEAITTMSSANIRQLIFILPTNTPPPIYSGRSLINNEKSNGDIRHPCFKPKLVLKFGVLPSFIQIHDSVSVFDSFNSSDHLS